MKFYSYDYVLSQISQQNWVMIIVSTFLVILTGFFAYKAFKDKKGTKFREFIDHFILTLIAFVLISITNLQTTNPMIINFVVPCTSSKLYQRVRC